MVKAKHTVIPFTLLLLISLSLLTSATYAWFAMSTTVAATGMRISAKSGSTFLLINTGDTNTAPLIQNARLTEVPLSVSAQEAAIYPSKPVDASDKDRVNSASGADAVAVFDRSTATVPENWYTAMSVSPDVSDCDDGTIKPLDAGCFSDYVIKRTVYITVAAGSANANNLTVTPSVIRKAYSGADMSGIKILVVTSNGGFAVLNAHSPKTDIKGNNNDITPSSVLTVDIYIFYDGNEDSVYLTNYSNLAGADIGLAFGADTHDAG